MPVSDPVRQRQTIYEVVEELESIHAHPGDVLIESHETGNICVFHTAHVSQLSEVDRAKLRAFCVPLKLKALILPLAPLAALCGMI